jgi:hypothetical protein
MDYEEKSKMVKKLREQYNGYIGIGSFFISCFIAFSFIYTLEKLGESVGLKMDWAGWLIMPVFLISMAFVGGLIIRRMDQSYEKIPDELLKNKLNQVIKKDRNKKANKLTNDRINTWGMVALAAILFATNPSEKKFVGYLNDSASNSDVEYGSKNLYLLTIYTTFPSKNLYLGILNNFIDLSKFNNEEN